MGEKNRPGSRYVGRDIETLGTLKGIIMLKMEKLADDMKKAMLDVQLNDSFEKCMDMENSGRIAVRLCSAMGRSENLHDVRKTLMVHLPELLEMLKVLVRHGD